MVVKHDRRAVRPRFEIDHGHKIRREMGVPQGVIGFVVNRTPAIRDRQVQIEFRHIGDQKLFRSPHRELANGLGQWTELGIELMALPGAHVNRAYVGGS